MVSANWCYLLSFLNLHSLRRFAIAWRGIGAAVFRLCQLNQPFSFKKVVTPNFSSALHVPMGGYLVWRVQLVYSI